MFVDMQQPQSTFAFAGSERHAGTAARPGGQIDTCPEFSAIVLISAAPRLQLGRAVNPHKTPFYTPFPRVFPSWQRRLESRITVSRQKGRGEAVRWWKRRSEDVPASAVAADGDTRQRGRPEPLRGRAPQRVRRGGRAAAGPRACSEGRAGGGGPAPWRRALRKSRQARRRRAGSRGAAVRAGSGGQREAGAAVLPPAAGQGRAGRGAAAWREGAGRGRRSRGVWGCAAAERAARAPSGF